MMQPTDPGQRRDLRGPGRLLRDRSTPWGVLVEPEVAAVGVVPGDVPSEQLESVAFAEDDDVVQQLPAGGADPALRRTVLPRAPERRADRLRPKRLDEPHHRRAEDRVPVEDQVAGRRIEGDLLADLPTLNLEKLLEDLGPFDLPD